MKRYWVIAVVVALLAVVGVVGIVSAQGALPPFGPGGMGGMMGGFSGQGIMHEYMQAALAQKLGISETELENLYTKGQTFWQIAQDKGFTAEQASQMMVDARSAALDKMVSDGKITKEQADWMKTRMGGMMGNGTGAGYGGCMGGYPGGQGTNDTSPRTNGTSTTPRGGMMGRGGRW